MTVASKLLDPDSARFDDLYKIIRYEENLETGVRAQIGDSNLLCGYVNAKNAYGGYTGRTLFYYNIEQDSAIILTNTSDIGEQMLIDIARTACQYSETE